MRRVVAALMLLTLLLAACSSSPPSHKPTGLHRLGVTFGTCGADATTGLQNRLNSAPSGSTITLAYHACYTINGILNVANTTGLTINGNGAILNQTVPVPTGGHEPILYLTQDTGLTIKNLYINGASANNLTNNGSLWEGGYGLMMEGDTNTTISGIHITNTQGDCVLLQAGNDITPADTTLNVNTRITLSSFQNCGYHGLTAEAVNGLVVQHTTWDNIDDDAIDFEVDAPGPPSGWAEDNVQILDNSFSRFGDDWFASLQAVGAPGIQEQHVTLSGNKLSGTASAYSPLASAYVEVWGTDPHTTTSPYLNIWLTVTNNTSSSALGKPYDESLPTAIALDSVMGVNISNNNFPVQSGTYAVLGYFNYGFVVRNNNFSGATGVLHSSTYGTSYTSVCGNHYGAGGSSLDSAC